MLITCLERASRFCQMHGISLIVQLILLKAAMVLAVLHQFPLCEVQQIPGVLAADVLLSVSS